MGKWVTGVYCGSHHSYFNAWTVHSENHDSLVVAAKKTNLLVSNEGIRMRKGEGRASRSSGSLSPASYLPAIFQLDE